jgi:hypothetical protein
MWVPHCVLVQRGAVVVPGPGARTRDYQPKSRLNFLLLSHCEALGGGYHLCVAHAIYQRRNSNGIPAPRAPLWCAGRDCHSRDHDLRGGVADCKTPIESLCMWRFLLFTGIKMWFAEIKADLERNSVCALCADIYE